MVEHGGRVEMGLHLAEDGGRDGDKMRGARRGMREDGAAWLRSGV